MQIKKNDTVTVIRGAQKGKSGKVLAAFPRENRVLVEGINVRKRHRKAGRNGAQGQVVDHPMTIAISNVAKK
jgi:large subunit ribosomal protein L24